jgi:hypothetical protein
MRKWGVVVARQREDCSAPFATGFGIATGIAIMLLAFGPRKPGT